MEVIEVMSRFAVIERASIDEAYMDLTAAVQQRLKNMSESQMDSQMLSTTYIQGFPRKSPDDDATTENDAPSKGNLASQLLLSCPGMKITLIVHRASQLTRPSWQCCISEEVRSGGLHQWLGTLPAPPLEEQSSAELQLTVGALIVEEMRAAVEEHTGFRCSAGISHNKVGGAGKSL